MKTILGREKYLENARDKFPGTIDMLKDGHTLYIDTKLMSKVWNEFDNIGFSTTKKDFLSMKVKIFNEEIALNKLVRQYKPFPNKTYKTFGNKFNKEGIIVELSEVLWMKIKAKGYIKLTLQYSLLPNEENRPTFKGTKCEDGMVRQISYATLNMKVNINNINNGNHILLDPNGYGLGNPVAFFEEREWENFKKYREKLNYINDEMILVPTEYIIEDDNGECDKLYYSLLQNIEFDTEPYDIYYYSKEHNMESFYFRKIISSCSEKDYNDNYFKPMGYATGVDDELEV